jgi:hypothetical protein
MNDPAQKSSESAELMNVVSTIVHDNTMYLKCFIAMQS